jgi:hypothetical protein
LAPDAPDNGPRAKRYDGLEQIASSVEWAHEPLIKLTPLKGRTKAEKEPKVGGKKGKISARHWPALFLI